MPQTTFTAQKNGFHFANKFNPQIYVGPFDIGMKGLCGGMTYAALDFYFAGHHIPAETTLPEDGSVLEEYIYKRHMTALGNTLSLWVERLINPFGARTSEFYHWGVQATDGGELEWLMQSIDAGKPCALGLLSPGGLFDNHFVVATGYEWKAAGRHLTIQIYDNKDPDKSMELTSNESQLRYVENNEETWVTYFVDRNYRPKIPRLGPSSCTGRPVRQLSGMDFSGLDLTHEDFRCARCVRTKFVGATAPEKDFSNAILTRANLRGANLQSSDFESVSADDAVFLGANLRSASFASATVARGDFYGADLHNAHLASASIVAGEFYGAHMASSDLSNGLFEGSNFYGADVSHCIAKNADFSEATFYGADLSHADLSGANGEVANFYGADLTHAKLVGGKFTNASFRGASMSNADLSHGDFTGADFTDADLSNVTRTGAIGLP